MLHGRHSNQHLLRMLGDALRRESERWSVSSLQETRVPGEVGVQHRDALVKYMADLNEKFDFFPDTFFLSVTILDRFISAVKARPKHLKLIGVTCLYLASKIKEEDEAIPGTLEFVRVSACGCSQAEVLRMEMCILTKLSWNLGFVTPLDFLHIFHALLFFNVPHLLDKCGHMTPARQLSLVTAKLERCVTSHLSLQHAPSTLALALLSLELELFSPNWLSITFMLQKMVHIDNDEMIVCRETCAHCLQSMGRANRYVYASKSPSPVAQPKSNKRRKVVEEEQEEEEDNIYDGIKQLYEEPSSCATQARCLSSAAEEAGTALRAVVI